MRPSVCVDRTCSNITQIIIFNARCKQQKLICTIGILLFIVAATAIELGSTRHRGPYGSPLATALSPVSFVHKPASVAEARTMKLRISVSHNCIVFVLRDLVQHFD
jgi:hypothetical protein